MKLNLPQYQFRFKQEGGKRFIFDRFRKKFLVLTPEEWVRQHFLCFMMEEKHFPQSLLGVEVGIKLNSNQLRCDIVAYDRQGQPLVIVECKAPEIKISQETFNQIMRYNFLLKVPYLIVTNGIAHYCCKVDYENQSYSYLKEIPSFEEMLNSK
ncbi:type I restriction enzyme HsdR N-terminal domain-containing protein [Prolixibacteraceae bacterium JC049]|nr:type I restriction enzyme HsdR N-terminal domain-containing protein [Prolixibacteraceae bacterium JC049]